MECLQVIKSDNKSCGTFDKRSTDLNTNEKELLITTRDNTDPSNNINLIEIGNTEKNCDIEASLTARTETSTGSDSDLLNSNGSTSSNVLNQSKQQRRKRRSKLANVLSSDSDEASKSTEQHVQKKIKRKKHINDLEDADTSSEEKDVERSQNVESLKVKTNEVLRVSEAEIHNNLSDREITANDNDNSDDFDNDSILNNDDTEATSAKPRKERKSKTISKMVMKELKSEQQRLLREKSFRIPYHTPEVKPLKDFLTRVPNLEKNVHKTRTPPESWSKNKVSFHDIYKAKPRLSLPNEVNLSSDDDSEADVVGSNIKQLDKNNEKDRLHLFMQRFKKHTEFKKNPQASKVSDPAVPSVKDTVKSRLELKDILKSSILKKRQESHYDMERQLKFFNEENYGDEEEEDEEDEIKYAESEDSEGSDEESPYKNADSDEGGEEVNGSKDSTEEQNEENSHNKLVVGDKEVGREAHKLPPTTINSDFYAEDSSSVLPPGQGEPTSSGIDQTQQMTPFTRLLKIGLLDSVSNKEKRANNAPSLTLPNEDTQDLYQDERSYDVEDDDEYEPTERFSLALDEDTQFDNVLNTQGFLQESKNKNARKGTAKKLFDDDIRLNSSVSMTQVLGFCSGGFTAQDNKRSSENQEEDSIVPLEGTVGLHIDEDGEGGSITQALGFLSGKFDKILDDVSKECDAESDLEVPLNAPKNNFESDSEASNTKECRGNDVNDVLDEENKENVDSAIKNKKIFHLDSDNEENEQSDDEQSEIEEAEEDTNDIKSEEIHGVWHKKLFYENEAELSGSDVGSDEDDDLGSEYDEYEVDADAEAEYISTRKLKKELHKIHQRKVLDDDRKELRLLQELYLEDGDLGGGVKRKRNFRWRNIDKEDFTNNANDHSGDDDAGQQIDSIDIEKRMDRLERDSYVQEIQKKESIDLDEDTQSVLQRISSQEISDNTLCLNNIHGRLSQSRHSYPQAKRFKRSGSFLGTTRSVANELITPTIPVGRSGKSFVFQSIDKSKAKKTKSNKTESVLSSLCVESSRRNEKLEKLHSKSVFNLI